MNPQGLITIVYGYHAQTPIPKIAQKETLAFRYAIIIETAFPEINTIFFQDYLFIKLISAIKEKLGCNQVQIKADESTWFSSVALFKNHLFNLAQQDRYPPLSILFSKNNRLLCVEETEFWALCGGPFPYADSYTASFYTKENKAEDFDAICTDMGIVIRARIEAAPCPILRPWWKKWFIHRNG